MKNTLLGLMAFVFGPTFGQLGIDTVYQTDSLNRVFFDELRSEGKFDSKGLKTGLWIEYTLRTDSVDNVHPVKVQLGDTLFDVDLTFLKSTNLQKVEGNYIDGVMTGRWSWSYARYYVNDQVIWEVQRETDFLNGEKHGKDREFTAGRIYHETSYSHDLPDGIELLFLFYGEFDGALYLRGYYKKGYRQNGTWYYKDGGIRMTKDFRKDPLVRVVEYHENGKIKAQYSEYGQEEILQGDYRVYDMHGKQIKKIKYKNGVEVKK